MTRWVNVEGKRVKVPDDATDAEISEILEAQPGVSGISETIEAPAVVAPENVPGESGVPGGVLPPGVNPVDTPEEMAAMRARQNQDAFKELAFSPFTGAANALAGTTMLIDKGIGGWEDIIQDDYRLLTGQPQLTPDEVEGRAKRQREFFKPISDVREFVHENTYQPQTDIGQGLEKFGGFMLGGLPMRATRLMPTRAGQLTSWGGDLVSNVAVPAIASEVAGKAFEGTEYESLARLIGAVGGQATTGVLRGANPAENVVRHANRNVTEPQWTAGAQHSETAARTPIRPTGAEIMSEATGGGSPLIDVQRYIESDPVHGAGIMGPFMADRPGQFEAANQLILDRLGIPASPRPTALGTRVQTAAQDVIDQARQRINQQTAPLYQTAGNDLVGPQDYAVLAADPSYAQALQRLRSHPEIGPRFHNYPDNSVAVIDAVTKDLFARGEAASNLANPQYGPHLGSLQTGAGQAARDVARQASTSYAAALDEQHQRRQGELTDITAGPVGRVSRSDGDTNVAAAEMWPPRPLAGSAPEIGEGVRHLLGAAPESTAQLIRNTWENRFNAAMEETQTGNREFGGAKFHKLVSGTPDKRAVMEAVIRELPTGPATMPLIDDVLAAMHMTGRRKQAGSPTEFNRTLSNDLTMDPKLALAELAATGGTSYFARARDLINRSMRRRSIGDLADILTNKDSVALMRAIQAGGAKTVIPEKFSRGGLQSLALLFNGPGKDEEAPQ